MLRFASTGYMELCSLPKVKQYTWKSNVCSYGTTNRIMHTVTWAERSLSQPVFKKTFCFFFWLEKTKTTSSECKNFIGSCYKLCRFHEISTVIYEKCCPFFWYRSVQRLRTLQEKRLLEKNPFGSPSVFLIGGHTVMMRATSWCLYQPAEPRGSSLGQSARQACRWHWGCDTQQALPKSSGGRDTQSSMCGGWDEATLLFIYFWRGLP